MNITEYLTTIYLPSSPQIRAAVSRSSYHCAITILESYLGRTATLDDLNRDTIMQCLTWYSETNKSNGEKRAASTVNRQRSLLRALWKFAYDRDDVDRPVKGVRKFPETPTIVQAWSVEQLEAMLRQVAKLDYDIAGIKAKRWWKSQLLSLYDTGLRISALMASRCEDYDAKSRTLFVRGESQKTGKPQYVKFSKQTAKALRKLPSDREFMFPWPYDQGGTWATLRLHLRRRILIPAKLPHCSKSSFHRFRKTTATELAAIEGAEAAAKQLQHGSVGITHQHYIDERRIDIKHAADVLPRPKVKRKKKRKHRKSESSVATSP